MKVYWEVLKQGFQFPDLLALDILSNEIDIRVGFKTILFTRVKGNIEILEPVSITFYFYI